jgi:branched-chain amino acid transport system permease protein
MSFILQTRALWRYGPTEQTADNVFPPSSDTVFKIGIFGYAWKNLIVVLITLPVLAALVYLVRSTRQGKGMRAVAQDTDAARRMGIDVNRTISFTFLLGGALAGAGGTLFVFWQTSTRYDLGFQLGLFAFTAAVLGGIGNLQGAALGAFIIGLLQAFNDGLSWHVPGSSWTQSLIFSILIHGIHCSGPRACWAGDGGSRHDKTSPTPGTGSRRLPQGGGAEVRAGAVRLLPEVSSTSSRRSGSRRWA